MKTSSNIFTVQVVPPAPPPPPPPPSNVSPNGTFIGGALLPAGQVSAAQITDGQNQVWTPLAAIGGVAGQIGMAKGGARILQSIDYATIKDGVFWVSDFKSGSGWQFWDKSKNDWTVTGNTGP